MKRNIICLCLCFSFAGNITAQENLKVENTVTAVNPPIQSDTAEANLLKTLSVKWMDAMLNHDSAGLVKLMSPQYKLYPWDGSSSVPRDRWIFNLLNKLRITKWEQTSMHALVYGDVAVVKSLYKWAGTHTGRPFEAAGHLTDVWVKVGNNWQVVSRSSEMFPGGGTLMK